MKRKLEIFEGLKEDGPLEKVLFGNKIYKQGKMYVMRNKRN